MNFRLKTGLAAMAVGLAISATAASAERIVMSCFFPPQNFVCTEWFPELKRRVEQATEGRVMVSTPPKSLAAPPDQYDGVVGGVMDGAMQFNAFLSNQVPGVQFSLLPFVGAEESEYASPALWNTYQKFFGDKDEYGEAVLVSLVASNGSEIWSLTDDPILTVDDIRNRKMWALPGTVAKVTKATGSPVVAGPAVQMLEIISKGVVDGYIGVPYTSLISFKILDYTKSGTLTEGKLFQPTFSFLMSRSKWEKISPEDRAAIMDALGEDFARWVGKNQDRQAAKAKEAVVAAGVELIEADPALERNLRELGQPQIDAWIERVGEMGVDGQEVLDYYAAEIEKNRAAAGDD